MIGLNVKGIGPAKAVAIAAALELGIRRDTAVKKREQILSSNDIAAFLKAQFQYHSKEVWRTL